MKNKFAFLVYYSYFCNTKILNMQKKEGTQTKYKHLNYPIEYGSMNKKECKATYLAYGAWVNAGSGLTEAVFNYNNHIAYLIRRFKEKEFGYNEVNIFTDVQSSEAKFASNKQRVANAHTYLSIELTFLFKTKIEYNNVITSKMERLATLLIDDLINLDYLDVQVSRKG